MTRSASTELAPAGIPAALWERVVSAPHRLLALDYDGTLVAFHADPRDARLAPRAHRVLARVADDPYTTAAVLSGRPLHELEELAAGLRCRLVAEHGWDVRAPDGTVRRHPLPRAAAEALEDAAERAAAAGVPVTARGAPRLERKRTALVLHLRGLDRREAGAWRTRLETEWATAVASSALRMERTDCGLELRASGRDKGTAIAELLRRTPDGTLAVVVGDDVTDEDGFRAARGRGFGILVARRRRPTGAAARVADHEAVVRLLERWPREGGRG
jgi:trehalose-phosphatase